MYIYIYKNIKKIYYNVYNLYTNHIFLLLLFFFILTYILNR